MTLHLPPLVLLDVCFLDQHGRRHHAAVVPGVDELSCIANAAVRLEVLFGASRRRQDGDGRFILENAKAGPLDARGDLVLTPVFDVLTEGASRDQLRD